MKQRIISVIVLLMFPTSMIWGQNDDDEYWIERNNQLVRSMQNDGMFKYVMGEDYEDLYGPRKKIDMSQIKRTILEKQQEQERLEREQQRQQQAQQVQKNQQVQQQTAQEQQNRVRQQQSGGIQFVVDPPRSQPKRSSSSAVAAQRQRENEQKEARERARREQRKRENEKKRQLAIEKLRREQEERERRNRKIEAEEREKSQNEYQHHAAQVDYQVNEGRDFMYNYQVQGTEIHESSYIPSTVSNEPISIAPKGGYGGKSTITLTGNEKVTTQMEEWQYSADFARTTPIPPCKDTIEVVPIGNGCGPAEGKFEQVAAKVGVYLDAMKNVAGHPLSRSLKGEIERLENVCSFVHDPGYVKAKNPQEKEEADDALGSAGGQIMAFFTKKLGGRAWHDSQEAARISRSAAEEHPEIKFDPNTQLLKRYRICR